MLVSNQGKGGFSILQQQIVENYLDGDMDHVSNIKEAQECGDGLLSFIINEAGDAHDLSEFIRMMELAQRQLGEVSMALAKIHETSLVLAAVPAFYVDMPDESALGNVASQGSYSGLVMEVAGGVVTQRINRIGDVVRHDASLLCMPVRQGDVVDIDYVDGRGVVGGKSIEKGNSR